MNTIYACTHVEKCAEKDDYENGCDPSTQVCVMHERCNVLADSLPGLLTALGKQFYLDIDDVFVPDDDDNGIITRIGYNRLENEDGDKPNRNRSGAGSRARRRSIWPTTDSSSKRGMSRRSAWKSSPPTASGSTADRTPSIGGSTRPQREKP